MSSFLSQKGGFPQREKGNEVGIVKIRTKAGKYLNNRGVMKSTAPKSSVRKKSSGSQKIRYDLPYGT
jgi:hypothetical protein